MALPGKVCSYFEVGANETAVPGIQYVMKEADWRVYCDSAFWGKVKFLSMMEGDMRPVRAGPTCSLKSKVSGHFLKLGGVGEGGWVDGMGSGR